MRRRVAAGGVAILAILAGGLAWPLPAGLLAPSPAAVVLDRRGDVLAERPADQGAFGTRPAIDAYGADLVAATLAAEDHRFRLHPGVDPLAIARAARVNLGAGHVREGGSTLTQQLARTLVPRGPGYLGKAGEAWLALRIEAHHTKDEVLAAYLGHVWYGNGATGADAAARLYFDRAPDALSLAQAATLAAIPRSPTALDPFRAPDRVRLARDAVLDRLVRFGLADADRVADARAEPLDVTRHRPPGEAPHLARRVARAAETVTTTLDLGLQRDVEAIVNEELDALRGRRVGQAAVLVVHNPTREVRVYVGSADWDAAGGQVDHVQAARSPGSALKPFLYALALEEGATLADVIADVPGTWSTTHGNWTPGNYSPSSSGPVTLREALATSLNVPAIRLAERVGVADLHRRLGDLGLTTLDRRPDHYGLGLALGDAEVRLDELVAAYAALASQGRWRPLRYTADTPRVPPRQVVRPAAAFLVADALDDPDARAPAFGRASVLEPDAPMAAKTGTSTAWRDNWAMGFNGDWTVGVWVGNPGGEPMAEISGVTGAGPILRRVMDRLVREAVPAPFIAPPTLARRDVCPLSGGLAGEHCPGRRAEWLPVKAERAACGWHAADGERLPAEYAAWAWANGRAVTSASAPVQVAYPSSGATFWLDTSRRADDQAIPLRATAAAGSEAVWEVDGEAIARVGPPFTSRWVPTPGDHVVAVTVDGRRSPPVRVWVGGEAPG